MMAREELARAIALSHQQVDEAIESGEDAEALARRYGLPANYAIAIVTLRGEEQDAAKPKRKKKDDEQPEPVN